MKRITPFECNYKNDHLIIGGFREHLGSARNKLANLIDTNWFYSMHWPDDHNEFLDKAQENLNTELGYARKRLAELEAAQKLLWSIDREQHDIGEG